MAGWTLVLALAFVPHTCLLSPVPRPVFTVTAAAPDLVAVFSAGLTAGSQVTLKLMDNQVLKAEFGGEKVFTAEAAESAELSFTILEFSGFRGEKGFTAEAAESAERSFTILRVQRVLR